VRVREVGRDRRAFLAQLVAAGGVSIASCAKCPAPAAPPRALEPTDPYALEVLEEPIVLRSGESLVDRSFVVSEEFRSTASRAFIVVEGNGVAIRNVRMLGSYPRAPGVHGGTVGIRIENVRDVALERVSIEGLPSAGISGHGVEGGHLRDITIRHCTGGIELRADSASRALRLERIYTENLSKPGDASLEEAGGWIGGAGLALSALRDSLVVDCTAVGQMFRSFELTNPQRVRIERLRGPTLTIRGTANLARDVREEPARDVVIDDCFLDKGLGRGPAIFEMSCLELSQNLESVTVERCVLNAAGQNGHAIRLSGNSHGRVVDCTFRGFNGVRGSHPAHALELTGGSTVNDDFERVNRFVDQKRIRLDLDPVSS
jgi:hypothetical protein